MYYMDVCAQQQQTNEYKNRPEQIARSIVGVHLNSLLRCLHNQTKYMTSFKVPSRM